MLGCNNNSKLCSLPLNETGFFLPSLVKVGTVWVNCWLVRDLNMPFGGAKMSGIGREGQKDSLEFYTEVKTVCIKH